MPFLTRQRHLITVREFRANLRATLEGEEPRIIGTPYTARALVIPLKTDGYSHGQNMRNAVAKARSDFKELIGCLEGL
jgi:hypothetical protein